MKPSQVCLPPSRQIILLVASLLLTPSGLAQQTESEAQGVIPPAQSVETNSSAEANPKITQNSLPKKSKAATRFTPTEKIHADDAVSFPVDI